MQEEGKSRQVHLVTLYYVSTFRIMMLLSKSAALCGYLTSVLFGALPLIEQFNIFTTCHSGMQFVSILIGLAPVGKRKHAYLRLASL